MPAAAGLPAVEPEYVFWYHTGEGSVYPLNTLCLFLGNREWHQSIPIADTLVPWASEWLLFYELWLATGGQWLGEGEHPPPGPVNRHARRRHRCEDASKLTRLTTALRLAYRPPTDLEELLYNARLTPNRPVTSPTSQPAHGTTEQADLGKQTAIGFRRPRSMVADRGRGRPRR